MPLLAGVALKTDYQRRTDGAERDSQNLARAFEEHIYRTFRSLDQQSRFLAEYYFRYPDKEALTEALRGLLKIEDAAVQHAIIDEHGRLAGSSVGTQTLGIDLSDRAHFRHYLQPGATPTYVSKPVVGRASGKASIQYTRRIEDAEGQFRGVAVVSFDPLYLNSFYQSVDVGDSGVISLVGTDGILRARSVDMAQTIGKDVSGGELMRRYAEAPNGTYRAPSGVDGVARTVSYRKVRDFPLLVVVGLGEADVMAGYAGYAAAVGGIYLFLLATLVLLGGLLRNYLSNRNEAERSAREAIVERRERQFLSSILQTAGVLVVVGSEPERFDAEGRRLFGEMAQDLGYALDNLDRQAALHLAAQVFEASGEAIVITDAAERKLGRALITQTWEAVLDAFPDGPVKLPAPPVQSIVSATYTDTAGAQQSLTAPAWLLDKDAEPGWLFPGYGTTWPETRGIPNAVRIRLTVGYGDTPASVPGSIRRWIRAHVAELFNNPEASAEGLQPMPLVDCLLDPYCIHEVAQ